MKIRWYLGTLILILTLAGVVNHQQAPIPNQEIVLQFNEIETSSIHAEREIATVTVQLQHLGASNIQVSEGEHGHYKITYFSDANIAKIKKVLSSSKTSGIEDIAFQNKNKPLNLPFEEDNVSYDLDVFEIQNGNDASQGFDGNVVIEYKIDGDRFLNPVMNHFFNSVEAKTLNGLVYQSATFEQNNAIALDKMSETIPEVRAGPMQV